jgi:nucleotide-binding universal stress UspA family protein
MSAPHPVVVGVDGSHESLVACDYACREALERGCPLLLVHAYGPIVAADEGADDFGAPAMRREGHRILRDAAKHVRRLGGAEPAVDVVVVRGRPREILAGLSRGAQLLVIGEPPSPHGEPGVAGNAIALAAAAACPVVVVPKAFRDGAEEPIVVIAASGARTGATP